MKNRDKYKNELMDVIKMDGRMCGFVIKHDISQMFGRDKESFCGETSCVDCATALLLWLDEEYTEPPKPKVDWDNVPVDTLVRVRDSEGEDWNLGYFKGVDKGCTENRFETWDNGRTSKTTHGYSYHWKYCELVEEEIDQLLKGGDVIDH